MKQSDTADVARHAAIEWAVRLSAGTPSDEDLRRFESWHGADPRHRSAWESVEQQLQIFATVRERGGAVARKVLTAPNASRRKLLQGSVGAMVTIGLTAYLIRRTGFVELLNPDFATGVGRRQHLTLADGSALMLDANSAVDVDFNSKERAIKLLRGQLFVRVAQDIDRPLVVYTRDGSACALGTAFCVCLSDSGTRVAVTHSKVRVRSASGDALIVSEGSVALMRRESVQRLDSLQADAEVTWINGYITAVNRPLSEVVGALNPYLRGLVLLSADAASLRVSGLFLLDDANATIRQIAQTLPVTVTYHTDYLIRIAAR
ncbi:FecR family protein [Paraburkholderia acidicola]|uniref:FecR family protein n=1 Tax=Paraburkholderia acidicola TaxID=1912599 RepID=A0ABV1LEY4_9BURK